MAYDPNEEEEEREDGRGRSARKREVRAFDELAQELMELSPGRCKKLPITDKLKRALHAARDTTSKAARKRHYKHLAGALRDSESEVEAIRKFLAGDAYVPVTGDESYRDLDALRASLCEEEGFVVALEEVCKQLPHVDRALISELSKAVHQEGEGKSFRALFKALRRAADQSDLDD